ncbi:MAG: hypothetical protein JSV03_03310 [Planctomycetota bacterium]|nr:MAG: hypothetical protein JSV03_03310 [Planctomycetota bacterium]
MVTERQSRREFVRQGVVVGAAYGIASSLSASSYGKLKEANGADANPKGSKIEYRGTKGTLYERGNKIEIVPEDLRTKPYPAMNPMRRKENSRQLKSTKKAFDEPIVEVGKRNEALHTRHFLDGVKTRKPCNCPVEVGHRSTSATLLANIAYDRKRHIVWDPQREQVVNDPEANKLLSYEYRPPWKLPG